MTESEKKSKWEFKPAYAKDALNVKSGAAMRNMAETAAKCAGLSWKEVLNMRYAEFLQFMGEFTKSEGFDEFGGLDFLEKK